MSKKSPIVSSQSPISEINELLKNIPPPPEKVPYPPKLVLYVIIIQGRKLTSKGCYCRLQIGNKIVETSKSSNSVNPIWNEQLHFRKVDYCDHLTIQLMDNDSEEIGSLQFSLVDFDVNEIVDKWYKIDKNNEENSAQLRIAFHLATRYDLAFHGQEVKIKSENSEDESEDDSIDVNIASKPPHSKDKDEKQKERKKSSSINTLKSLEDSE